MPKRKSVGKSTPSKEQDYNVIVLSSDDEASDDEWHHPKGNQPKLTAFTCRPGLRAENLNTNSNITTATCYELLVPNELFEEIAEHTNLYASQESKNELSQDLGEWTVTNKNEIKRFFGLIIWMGLVKLPSLPLYWSYHPIYIQTLPRKVMPRDRFEILLKMIYFADSRSCEDSDSVYKIQSLVETLEENFKKYYVPTKDICIDEWLVPFYGRFTLGHHLAPKRHKNGIRIIKLCCRTGYTYSLRVINGKFLKKNNKSSTKIVKSLCRDLFDKGYTLYTDRWYTSIKLANRLIAKNTHLVGALRSSRRGNPKRVVSKKLKREEMIAQENNDGITILKWKDKRKTMLLSTKHSSEMVYVQSQSGPVLVPKIVRDYNKGKSVVDIADRVNAYHNPITKSVKWYRRAAFELLLNVTVTNSFILYKNITEKNISIIEFRKKLAKHLTGC